MRYLILMTQIALISTGSTVYADVSGDPEKLPGYVVAYETDASGNAVRDSLAKLVRSVRSGADIKIGFFGTLDQFHTCDSVIIYDSNGTDNVGCNVNNHMTLVDETNLPTIRSTPYWTFFYWDTEGNWALARASVYGGSNTGQSTGTSNFKKVWFARVR